MWNIHWLFSNFVPLNHKNYLQKPSKHLNHFKKYRKRSENTIGINSFKIYKFSLKVVYNKTYIVTKKKIILK